MKKRIGWIDVARGITMFAVVIGHSLYNYNDGTLYRFIYAFHMPLFFILSGYLFHRRPYNKELQSGFLNLLVPYYTTGVIMLLLYWLAGIGPVSTLLNSKFVPSINDLISAILYGAGVQPTMPFSATIFASGMIWFLPAMMISIQIFNVVIIQTEKIEQKNIVRLMIFSSLAIIGKVVGTVWLLPLSLNAAMFSLMFLYIGYLMQQENFFERLNFVTVLSSIVMWSVAAYTQPFNLSSAGTPDALLGIVGAVGGAIVIFKVSQLIENGVSAKLLEAIGKNSILFFCFHNIDVVFSNVPAMIMNMQVIDDWVKIILVIVYRMIIPTLAVTVIPRIPVVRSLYLNRKYPFHKSKRLIKNV